MKLFANFGDEDPVELGEIELSDLPGVLEALKAGNIEDTNGVDYFYSEHEIQVTPFHYLPVIHVYFDNTE